MSSKDVYSNLSETTNAIVSNVVSNISDVASSVKENVEGVVSPFSSGVGDALHNISCGVKRMVTSPPTEEETKKEIEFYQTVSPILPTPHDSPTQSLNSGDLYSLPMHFEASSLETNLTEHNLGLLENHFSEPEMFELQSDANIEDIQKAIVKTKDFILNCEEASNNRRIYVQKLIRLRLMLERAKEVNEISKDGIQIIQGHEFTPELSRLRVPTKQFCSRCSRVIWNLLHVAYRCSLCGYVCHGKCVKSKHPKCPSLKFSENPQLTLDICPEVGLAAQDFRCSQCNILLNNKSVWNEPRLCDYSGLFFCPSCHWNGKSIIPARVVHNWDFDEQYVSEQSKHFLNFIKNKPLIFLEELNPQLFSFLGELHTVKKIRQDLIVMKEYLRTCRLAQEHRLLRKLAVRQHFVDDSRLFSLQDLEDLNRGILVPFLRDVHQEFTTHIKTICEACKGKGFICELCHVKEVIFPFDEHVSVCRICNASFHEKCFDSASVCPKCIRQSSRRLKHDQYTEGIQS